MGVSLSEGEGTKCSTEESTRFQRETVILSAATIQDSKGDNVQDLCGDKSQSCNKNEDREDDQLIYSWDDPNNAAINEFMGYEYLKYKTIRCGRRKADEYAEMLLKNDDCLQPNNICDLLQVWKFRPNAYRRNIMPDGWKYVHSGTFGLVTTLIGQVQPAIMTKNFPHVPTVILKWVNTQFPDVMKNKKFTSIFSLLL